MVKTSHVGDTKMRLPSGKVSDYQLVKCTNIKCNEKSGDVEITQSGLYKISVAVTVGYNQKDGGVHLYVNGAFKQNMLFGSHNDDGQTWSKFIFIQLTKSDKLHLHLSHSDVIFVADGKQFNFSGELLF